MRMLLLPLMLHAASCIPTLLIRHVSMAHRRHAGMRLLLHVVLHSDVHLLRPGVACQLRMPGCGVLQAVAICRRVCSMRTVPAARCMAAVLAHVR